MEVIVIESKAYNSLLNEMRGIIKDEFQKLRQDIIQHGIRKGDWLSPNEVREMLGIGRTKYFALKNEGAFVFSQFGRKAKISRKSIDEFLKKNTF